MASKHVLRNNIINLLTPNDDYSGRTTPLTSKRFILYIYSTNIGTEYFKHSTRSVRKVSDRIFVCEHLMDYNLARLHEPTLNLSAHA